MWYYMVNFTKLKYNVKIDLGDNIKAHCYVEYKVGWLLVNVWAPYIEQDKI